MKRYLALCGICDLYEDYFGRFDGVGRAELESETVFVARWIERVIEDVEIHLPFAKVGSGDKIDAGWEGALDLD